MSGAPAHLSASLCTFDTEGGIEARVPLEVNAVKGLDFQCSSFKGQVLFINRPDPELPGWPYYKQFKEKMRRFEFRLQGRFLADPAEWVMSIVSILCKARGVSYSYNLERIERADGGVTRPYLAFPVVAADAIIVTPAGEVPPPLSQPMEPVPLKEKLAVQFNTKDTFTFAYWSKQADFERWEICHMPFGWSSNFMHFIGQQPVHLTAYSLDSGGAASSELHAEGRKRRLMSLILNNRCTRCNGDGDEVPAEATGPPPAEAPRYAPSRKWSLEQAELSFEEFERLWQDPGLVKANMASGPLPSSRSRLWSWFTNTACCSSTIQRHGQR